MLNMLSGMSALIEDRTRVVLERQWGVVLDERTIRDTGMGEAERWVRVERQGLIDRVAGVYTGLLGRPAIGSVAR